MSRPLNDRVRDGRWLDRLERRVKYRMIMAEHAQSPWLRARLLGEVADLLADPDVQDLFRRCRENRERRPWMSVRKVPGWVRGEDIAGYRAVAREKGEYEAAAWARRMKRVEAERCGAQS